MKYIIDIPDKADYITAVYMDNGLPVAYKSDRLEDLKPYTEPDREAIENEVWNFVRFMSLVMDSVDRFECFGSEGLGYASANSVVRDMTYQEAKAKYEAWKSQKDDAVKQKVITLADEIGIHKLYAIVRDIRGE